MDNDGTFAEETVADPSRLNLPIRYTGAPLKNADGHIIGAVEYAVDITAELEERSKVRHLVDSLNGIPTPVMSIDRDFIVRAMNPAGADVLGLLPEQCVGRKCYDLFKTPHCRTSQCACKQAMDKDGTFTEETVADPSRLNLPIRYTGAPLKNADGSIVGAVEFVLNIADELDKRRSNNEVTDVLFKLKTNDLRARVSGTYTGELNEVKKAMNDGLDAINAVLLEVASSVQHVTETSGQVSNASQKLAEGTQEQAAAVEEMSASIEQTDQQIRENAKNAGAADDLVTKTNDMAECGRAEMERMLTAMNEISESSHRISKIMKVIDEIAFQTNILALNAAVEAARAGKYGRGFAVVAQEVRNLAGRSAKAAQETAEMIEESNKKVTHGVDIARRTANALADIVGNVTNVKDLVAEIASASKEQAEAMAQVASGMGQISAGVSAVSAQSEQTAAASEELTSIARGLKQSVETFTLMEREEVASRTMELPSGITPEILLQLVGLLKAQGMLSAHPAGTAARGTEAGPTRSTKGKSPGSQEQVLPLDTDCRGYGKF